MNTTSALRRRLAAALIASAFVGGVAVADESAGPTESLRHLRLVSLRSTIGFALSEAQLDAATELEVEALGVALANLPRAEITLSGYTDASGPGELNLQLSQQRVDSVRQALRAAGVDASRIHVEANGEWFSQRTPPEPQAQARQRRVDIRVEQPL